MTLGDSGEGDLGGFEPKPVSDVCAVIYGSPLMAETVTRTLAAVRLQRVAPAMILVAAALRSRLAEASSVTFYEPVASQSSLSAGVSAAASGGARWLWLLDGATIPEPDALSALLNVIAEFGGPGPLLLSSKVTDGAGHLHPAAMLRHEIFEKELTVAAAGRHLVQLRTACHGSVLVSSRSVGRFGPPRSDLSPATDITDWSARMLRRWEDAGYLVPASVAVRLGGAAARPSWRDRLRLLTSGAWSPTERLWEAFLLGEEVLAQRSSRRRAAQGFAGVGAPGLRPSRTPRRMTKMTRGAKRWKRR